MHAVDWAITTGAAADVVRDVQWRLQRRRRRRQQTALAAVFALLLTGAGWRWAVSMDEPVAPPGPRLAPLVSTPRQQTLDDGSLVELKSGAAIRIEYSAAIRRVVLERGEAHFHVAKNPARPFVVEAGAVGVRAVGTAFSVELSTAVTDIVVTEGRVAVETSAASGTDAGVGGRQTHALLEAGDRAVIDTSPAGLAPAPRVVQLSPAELARRLAWRVPSLEFSGTPLEEALPLINRYRTVQLVLGDAALGKVRLSGVLRADNAPTLLRLLEEEHGIVARPRGETTLVLSRAGAR